MGLYGSLGQQAPVYVTRKTANGDIASYSMSLGMSLLVLLLLWANLVGWGIYGLIVLAMKVV